MTPPVTPLPSSNASSAVDAASQSNATHATSTPKPLTRSQELDAAEATINQLKAASPSLDNLPLAKAVLDLLPTLLPNVSKLYSAGSFMKTMLNASAPATSKAAPRESSVNLPRSASSQSPVALDRASTLADEAGLALINYGKAILLFKEEPRDSELPVATGRSVTVGGA